MQFHRWARRKKLSLTSAYHANHSATGHFLLRFGITRTLHSDLGGAIDLRQIVGRHQSQPNGIRRLSRSKSVGDRLRERRHHEVDQTIGEMFVRGVSIQGVGLVLAHLNGAQPSAATVSRVFHSLDAEYAAWQQGKLEARKMLENAAESHTSGARCVRR